jgi:hypothetical protein
MRALTLHRPWDRLIVKGVKLVENRSWKPTLQQLRPGEVFAIHQGKTWDTEGIEEIRRIARDFPHHRAALGVLASAVDEGGDGGQIVGVVEYRGCSIADPSPWFTGPIGWGLADAWELPTSIPCRGFQGLWTVPLDVQAQIDAQIAVRDRRYGCP